MPNNLKQAAAELDRLPLEMLTTTEVALFLRCNRKTVWKLAEKGILTPYAVGRVWRFDRGEVLRALRRRADRQQG